MGYEIQYKFCREIERGVYNRDEIEEAAVQVGAACDDVSVETLAGKVMALLARRAILVTELDIFEYAKKSVAYREADDGIYIRNKKFRFDDGPPVEGVEVTPNVPAPNTLALPGPAVQSSNMPAATAATAATQEVDVKKKGPLRYEIFSPEKEMGDDAIRRGFKFTYNKEYPIYGERRHPKMLDGTAERAIPDNYLVEDDEGNLRLMSSLFFVPKGGTMIAANAGVQSGLTDAGLNWNSVVKDDNKMPELR